MHVHSSSWIKKLLTVSSAHSTLNKFNSNMGIRSSVLTDLAYLYSGVLQTCLSLMSFYLKIMQGFFFPFTSIHMYGIKLISAWTTVLNVTIHSFPNKIESPPMKWNTWYQQSCTCDNFLSSQQQDYFCLDAILSIH